MIIDDAVTGAKKIDVNFFCDRLAVVKVASFGFGLQLSHVRLRRGRGAPQNPQGVLTPIGFHGLKPRPKKGIKNALTTITDLYHAADERG